jgi:alpha-beta hydrolase superfamily lysophospholipase
MTSASAFGIVQPLGYPTLPEGWEIETESFSAEQGTARLFAFLFRKKSPSPIRNVLVVSHGFGEHSGRYLHFAHYLGDSVDAIYAFDHRGHGRSDGLRGDAEEFDALVDDLRLAVERMGAHFPEATLHLLGHSFGGHIALRLGFLHPGLPLASFQVSAPFLGLYKEPALPLKLAAQALSKTWSTLSLTTDIDPKIVSRDEAVIENYGTDRLNHSRMTPRLYATMTKAQRDTLARREGFAYPLVLHLPLADELVNGKLTRGFFDALELPGKKLYEYPGFRHEPMNEIGKETFFENMAAVIAQGALRSKE